MKKYIKPSVQIINVVVEQLLAGSFEDGQITEGDAKLNEVNWDIEDDEPSDGSYFGSWE